MHDVDGDGVEACCADADIIAGRVCARHMSCQNTYSPCHWVLASELISQRGSDAVETEQSPSSKDNEEIKLF